MSIDVNSHTWSDFISFHRHAQTNYPKHKSSWIIKLKRRRTQPAEFKGPDMGWNASRLGNTCKARWFTMETRKSVRVQKCAKIRPHGLMPVEHCRPQLYSIQSRFCLFFFLVWSLGGGDRAAQKLHWFQLFSMFFCLHVNSQHGLLKASKWWNWPINDAELWTRGKKMQRLAIVSRFGAYVIFLLERSHVVLEGSRP